jgi:hypothetical protein
MRSPAQAWAPLLLCSQRITKRSSLPLKQPTQLPIHYIGIMNRFSIFWHIAVTAVFCAVLPAVAPTHQPASFVFGKLMTAEKSAGIPNPAYSVLLSALMSQFTLTVRCSVGAHLGMRCLLGVRDAPRTPPSFCVGRRA